MIIKFKGNMIVENDKNSKDFELDLLSRRVSKAWDARSIYDIIENEDIAINIIGIDIDVDIDDNDKLYYNVNVYCSELLDLSEQSIIRNDLSFEINDLNEYIMSFPEFDGLRFDGNSIQLL